LYIYYADIAYYMPYNEYAVDSFQQEGGVLVGLHNQFYNFGYGRYHHLLYRQMVRPK